MKLDYLKEPFYSVPQHLRGWFGEIVATMEAKAVFPIWRVVLPSGSSPDDVIAVSHCLRELFPDRARAEHCQPVDEEFRL